MSVFERNGYWYAEVPLPNGKKLKRSVGKKGIVTKAMARQVEQDLKRKVKLGQLDMIRDIPAFNDFIPEFIAHQKDIKRNRDWARAEYSVKLFAKYYGNKKLSEITPSDIDDYKQLRLAADKQPATVNRELASVRAMFSLSKKRKRLFGENPVSVAGLMPVSNQKERILTAEEEDLLLAAAEEPLKSFIQIALHTGLRLNSIRTLTWQCIDFSANTITVAAVNSKKQEDSYRPYEHRR